MCDHEIPIPHFSRLLLVRRHCGSAAGLSRARRRSDSTDVVIVGGGFTGLSAAAHLAKAGTNVALIEGNRIGDGASGRNGGQLGTGQRAGAEELEKELGFARAKALFDVAEEAKAHLLEFAATTRSRSISGPAISTSATASATCPNMSSTPRR